MAKENTDWGYDRIVGAMANLGYTLSDQTVGNILQRHGTLPAPERKRTTTWTDFIRAHMAVLAGTDIFSVEILMLCGLVTYYALFFIHLDSRKVEIAGITPVCGEFLFMRQLASEKVRCNVISMNSCRVLRAEVGGRRQLLQARLHPETDEHGTGCSTA